MKYHIDHPIQAAKDGKYWIVRYDIGDGERWTQGTSEYNAFEMAADAIATCLDIRASWYRRLIFKIFRI